MMLIGMKSRMIDFLNKIGYEYVSDEESLIILSSYGKVKFVEFLIQKDLNLEICLNKSLINAVELGCVEIVNLLINKSNGVNIDFQHLLTIANDKDIFNIINNHLMTKN